MRRYFFKIHGRTDLLFVVHSPITQGGRYERMMTHGRNQDTHFIVVPSAQINHNMFISAALGVQRREGVKKAIAYR